MTKLPNNYKNNNKTGVINDSLVQTHSLTSSKHCFRLKFVLFWKVGMDGQTYEWTTCAINSLSFSSSSLRIYKWVFHICLFDSKSELWSNSKTNLGLQACKWKLCIAYVICPLSFENHKLFQFINSEFSLQSNFSIALSGQANWRVAEQNVCSFHLTNCNYCQSLRCSSSSGSCQTVCLFL